MGKLFRCSNCNSVMEDNGTEYLICSGCGKKYKNPNYQPQQISVNSSPIAQKNDLASRELALTVLRTLNSPNSPMTETQKGDILKRFSLYLPKDETQDLLMELNSAKQNKYPLCMSFQPKNPYITLVLSIYCGFLGFDRFYIGETGVGVCKLLFGLLTFGLWPFIDIFVTYKRCRKKNCEELVRLLKR